MKNFFYCEKINTMKDNITGFKSYILMVNVNDIPDNFSLAPNPRSQNTNKKIPREIASSLKNSKPGMFFYLNTGIVLSVRELHHKRLNDGRHKIVLTSDKEDGILNGGHTYKIILDNRGDKIKYGSRPQFVKIEIYENLSSEERQQIAETRNTNMVVKESSINNLKGKYDWLKSELNKLPYVSNGQLKIGYKENEDDVDVYIDDIIRLLSLFNLDNNYDKTPTIPYNSKGSCVKKFINPTKKEKDEGVDPKKVIPLIPKVIELFTFLEKNIHKMYPNGEGNLKRRNIIKDSSLLKDKKGNPIISTTTFTKERTGTNIKYSNGILIPLMFSFRALVDRKYVEENNGEVFYFKKDPIKILSSSVGSKSKIGEELLENFFQEIDNSNIKHPNDLGRSLGIYRNVYLTMKLKLMEMT